MGWVNTLFNVATGYQLARRTVEEARYDVLEEHPDFEVRRYAARVVAETPIAGRIEHGEREAFRRLFAYIDAKDRPGEPLARVNPSLEGVDHIAMTTPVTEVRHGDLRVMAFTMPANLSLDELPAPGDPAVTLRRVPPVVVAAMRFAGRADEAQLERRARTLATTVAMHGYRAVGAPVLAQYDPPWVIAPFRRNEVIVEVERR